MKLLISQIDLEVLLGRQDPPPGETVPPVSVIYFTATWCGACKKLDMGAIEAAAPGVNWLKCDVDANNYSPGYCGVRGIPAFMIIASGKPIGPFKSSNTQQVVDWLQGELAKLGHLKNAA